MSESKATMIDDEFSAMQDVYAALEPLSDEARTRVAEYVIARLEITLRAQAKASAVAQDGIVDDGHPEITEQEKSAPKYGSFAELFDDAQPTSNAEKALVAGYWLQVCEGGETFDGQSANTELKHLGHRVANVTNAIDSLKGQKPALALQIKKAGKSQQARKVYKITVAGIRRVEEMVSG